MRTLTTAAAVKPLLLASLFVLCKAAAFADTDHKIRFSGYEWIVKSSDSMGPGPNAWRPDNVALDAKGQLHLKITNSEGKWCCAEVMSTKRFGFGTYEFQIEGPIDKFDPGIVLGLFNYPTSDVGGDGTNEIDIEFARWGNAAWPNGNFTVWPPIKEAKNGSDTYQFSMKEQSSTHRFVWESKSVSFESRTGDGKQNSELIHSWKYQPEDFLNRIGQNPEPVLMNLWLFRGKAPSDAKQVEIVIKRFKFTPQK